MAQQLVCAPEKEEVNRHRIGSLKKGGHRERAKSPPKKHGMILFQAFQLLDVLQRRHELVLHLLSDTLEPITSQPKTPGHESQGLLFFSPLCCPRTPTTTRSSTSTSSSFIAKAYPRLDYLVAICTGVGLAAKAGVLDGKRATTNKASWGRIVPSGPRVKWERRARWTVDGKLWTSSGVTAGLDNDAGVRPACLR
ncbi:ThiJ/PfpI family protein [Coccidioides immitis RMSCC 3703]|uniref:ThiJ/PfpI family protein n=1 Tax=Coccidioides immitis RMSCC 3703 TaxID=454286 RepID=A0A0J8QXL8_COCIT|nr:ThiJ/PfpI family protein [Coccidioides immitis RMSCC 3703]